MDAIDGNEPSAEMEKRWQAAWAKAGAFVTDLTSSKPKYYVLDMFPYPSGTGLHVGHLKGYVATDVIARYKRMRGFEVLHPMGWDSFGLPTERQAAKEGKPPEEITARNINTFRTQLQALGLSYDWTRELATSDERYYRWTQWMFIKMFEKGLAYQADAPVNWCPALGTVLANEEVRDGKYVETGDLVERRPMRQWMLRITAYADRLIQDLDLVDWPESVKEMQRNWIGKSQGVQVRLPIEGSGETLEIFTTRIDTIFGVTFVGLAPDHPLLKTIVPEGQRAQVSAACETILANPERGGSQGAPAGIFTGAFAVHPLTGERVPIWVTDYTLLSYGTGAVMGVPAHDARDHAFAKHFTLPIKAVVGGGPLPFEDEGPHLDSGPLDGLDVAAAKEVATGLIVAKGLGKRVTHYRLRDWLFSRQRRWGEPIPMVISAAGGATPVPLTELPVKVRSEGAPPDATIFPHLETNTMPQWAGSCWYYLRFLTPWNDEAPWRPEDEKHWVPIDLYVGGAEHATLHLLYARFWHKVLFDLGLVKSPEPFMKLVNQGMVLARSYRTASGKYVNPAEVKESAGLYATRAGESVAAKVEKMSKSKLNGTPPEEIIERHGADALRMFEMFIGPLEDNNVWDPAAIIGVRRFLDRLAGLCLDDPLPTEPTPRQKPRELIDRAILEMSTAIDSLRLNTCVSRLMILANELSEFRPLARDERRDLAKIVSPFAPHLAEEIWAKVGETGFVSRAEWPVVNVVPAARPRDVTVQINGKTKGALPLDPELAQDQERTVAAIRAEPKFSAALDAEIVKVIFVPGRLVNFVVRPKA